MQIFKRNMCRFSVNSRVIYNRKKTKINSLRPPFNHFANIVTKCLLCHTGGWSKLTEQKIHLMSSLCDEAMNMKVYNWKAWFINQLLEMENDVMEVKEEVDKGKFTFHGKLKFGKKVLDVS